MTKKKKKIRSRREEGRERGNCESLAVDWINYDLFHYVFLLRNSLGDPRLLKERKKQRKKKKK